MAPNREKVIKVITKLYGLYQDPQPGLITWLSFEHENLHKLYYLLKKLGFGQNESKTNKKT